MSDVRGFVAAVQERYGLRPVVPFEQPVEIGDIGTIGKDGTWNPVSTTVTVRSATEMSGVIGAIRLAYHLRKERPEEKRWYRDFAFIFAVGDADRLTAMLAPASTFDETFTEVQ
jgi:hypothetical protein